MSIEVSIITNDSYASHPIYTWGHVGVGIYEIYLASSGDLFTPKFYRTISASQICQNNTCSVDLTDYSTNAWLFATGEYQIFVNASPGNWGANQYDHLIFTVGQSQPSMPASLSGNASGINWTLTGNGVNAAWFQVYVAPSNNIFNPIFFKWLSREEVCGSWEGTSCTKPLFNLSTGEYVIYMQAWGVGGFASDGNASGQPEWQTRTFLVSSTSIPTRTPQPSPTTQPASTLTPFPTRTPSSTFTATPTITLTSSPIPTSPSENYKIAIPAYFYPEANDCISNCYWQQISNSSNSVALVIANPNSGPGNNPDPLYVEAIKTLQDKDIAVIGYVPTSYSQRDINQVKAEIDKYYEWYAIDGIFLDEASNSCDVIEYYREAYEYIKNKTTTEQRVVINPGTNTPECFASVADTIVIFENDYENYIDWQLSGWEDKYPIEKFWHIVHSTDQSNLASTIDLAKNRNAGWIYITSDVLSNPYDTLPVDSYWNEMINRIK